MRNPYHPVGSRFVPTDLGLVRSHLRNMVERKQSRVITTMDVYQAEPWLLPHVSNPLFKKKQWYYFVPRTERRKDTPDRAVPGRGGSEGGSWKSNVKKEAIKDGNKIMGYKQPLTYYTKVHGKEKKTEWLMTEYSLNRVDGGFQNMVLCLIRDKAKTKVDKIINHVPQPQPQPQPQVGAESSNNIILPDQLVHKEADLTGFAEDLEMIMLEGQEEEIPQIHGNNNNNVMMSNQQVQEEADLTGFADELEMIMQEGPEDRDITEQQQQQEEITIIPLAQIHDNNNNDVMMSNQQVQEEADVTGFADELETIMLEGDRDATEHQGQMPNQQVQEEAGLAGLTNELDMLMQMREGEKDQQLYEKRLGGQEEGELTQQQKQLEEVIPIPPMLNNKNDDIMMTWSQELFHIEEFLIKDNEGEDLITIILPSPQPIYQAQDWSQLVSQEDDTMMMMDNPNNA